MIILAGVASYRRAAFRAAAERLEIDLIEVADIPEPLAEFAAMTTAVDYNQPEEAAATIASMAVDRGATAILAIDDTATLLAAAASDRSGLPHNDPDSALAARDKLVMRQRLESAGEPVPWFRSVPLSTDPRGIAAAVAYPCVVKPTALSGSRGVIRANDPEEFASAFDRTKSISIAEGIDPATGVLIVEEYLPGDEVAVEAIMTEGRLQVLSIFDKPDPLVGPFFEETIYVTPSRLPATAQATISDRTAGAAEALGIRTGPVHAELRVHGNEAWVIELAGRSIGGMCSTILEFGSGTSLEELILLNAVGRFEGVGSMDGAAGVMMIPIPGSGVLRCVNGLDEARTVAGVTGVQLTAQIGLPIQALPEGASYLGFIFAKGDDPATVEQSLREAHSRLEIRIDRLLSLRRID